MSADRIYAAALTLFPDDFRRRFGPEMRAAFRAAAADRRSAGVVASLGFLLDETAGLAVAIGREWLLKLTDDPASRARVLPDCRRMRPVGVTRAEWAAGLDCAE